MSGRDPLLAKDATRSDADVADAMVKVDAPLEYCLVLVHPAEGEAPKSFVQSLLGAACGCSSSGSPEAADVLARRRALHARMRSVGLLLDFALSRDGDDMLVKVKAPEALLEAK